MDGIVAEASNNPISDGDSETDDEESIHAQKEADLNRVRQMLGKNLTPVELV